MSDTTLQSIAQNFTPEYKEFIESGYADTLAQQIGEKYQVTEEDLLIIRNGFRLHLHFVLLNPELANFLIEEARIEAATAQAISEDYLADLPTNYTNQHDEVTQSLRTPTTDIPSPVFQVQTIENDVTAAQEGQTYTSSQETLLQPVPKPNQTQPLATDQPPQA